MILSPFLKSWECTSCAHNFGNRLLVIINLSQHQQWRSLLPLASLLPLWHWLLLRCRLLLLLFQAQVQAVSRSHPRSCHWKEGCWQDLIQHWSRRSVLVRQLVSLNQVQAATRSRPRRCLKREGCSTVQVQAATQSRPKRCLKREGCSPVQVQVSTQSLQSRKEVVVPFRPPDCCSKSCCWRCDGLAGLGSLP